MRLVLCVINFTSKTMENKAFEYIPKGNFHKEGLLLLVFLVIVIIGFYPAFDNEFVYWDDQYYILENGLINQPTVDNLSVLFTKIISLNYHPITMFSLWLNAFLSGTQSAFPFILTNVIFHFFNTVLVYFFFKNLHKESAFAAIFTSFIFAIHPLHVESVAWVSERKDVLYSFFFLASSFAYLRYSERKNTKWYFASWLLFLLSCGAKAMAVSLVSVLWLIDYFRERKFTPQTVLIEKLPFIILALLVGGIAVDVQAGGDFFGILQRSSDSIALNPSTEISIWYKLSVASYGLFFYLTKFLFPFDLAALHPHDAVIYESWFQFMPLCGFLLGATLIFTFLRDRKVAFGLGFFAATIALVLQFIPVGVAIVAERYTYLPYLGLAFATAILLQRLSKYLPKTTPWMVMIGLSTVFTYLTHKQTDVWQNHITLFGNTVEKYPKNPYAREYLAAGYHQNGQIEKAITELEYAVKELGYTHTNSLELLGVYYEEIGDLDKALAFYDEAIDLRPDNYTARYNRGILLVNFNPEAALLDFDVCEASKDSRIRDNILEQKGICYGKLGDYKTAIEYLSAAISVFPESEMLYYNRAVTYERMGLQKNAAEDYKAALELNSDLSSAEIRLQILHQSISS